MNKRWIVIIKTTKTLSTEISFFGFMDEIWENNVKGLLGFFLGSSI